MKKKMIPLLLIACATNVYAQQEPSTPQDTTKVHYLDDVTVKMPKTRVKKDAIITTVTGSVLEKAGTLEQLLDKIPNVSVNDGSVNVFGRGVPEIYINGQKMRDDSELSQISSLDVKDIEVVTNPGARYDADVTSVIRIYTKKREGDGFGFGERANLKHNMKKMSYRNQFDFNYRKSGLELTGMIDLQRARIREESRDPIWVYNKNVWMQDQVTDGNYKNDIGSGRLALNYQIDDKNALGIRYDMTRRWSGLWLGAMNTILYKDDVFSDESLNDEDVHIPESRHSVNMYYSGKIGKVQIDWNADGLWRDRTRNQNVWERYRSAEGENEERLIESLNNTKNDLYATKLILSMPWGGGTFSVGGEYTYTQQVNDFRNPQHVIVDNYTTFIERTGSLFAEYSHRIGEANLQAGLRFEHINSDYYENGKYSPEPSRTYSNVFPTLSLTAPLGDAYMSLQYSAGIARPSYEQLRGSISYLCRYAYETGNPLLQPTTTQNLSWNISYKWMQFELGFNHLDDPIFYTSKLLDPNDILTYVYYENVPSYNKMTASLNFSPTFGRWSPMLGFGVLKQWVEMESPFGHKKLNAPYGTITFNNTFRLPKDILFSWDMTLNTKGYEKNSYNYRNNFMAKASITKTLLKGRMDLQLDGTNIFGTYQAIPELIYCGPMIMIEIGRVKQSAVQFNMRYRFNTVKSKYKGTGAGLEQKSRM